MFKAFSKRKPFLSECSVKTFLIGILTRIYKNKAYTRLRFLWNTQISWRRFFLLLQNTLLSWSQTCSKVPASSVIEALFSICSWVRIIKQFQSIPNNMWNLFGQHTQAYITFVFIIIKILHSMRMGSTTCQYQSRVRHETTNTLTICVMSSLVGIQ